MNRMRLHIPTVANDEDHGPVPLPRVKLRRPGPPETRAHAVLALLVLSASVSGCQKDAPKLATTAIAVVVAAPAAEPAGDTSAATAASVASAGTVVGGMVLVPAGGFMMGSNDGAANEKPVHGVSVRAFWMDATEVTVSAFEGCVREGRCSTEGLEGMEEEVRSCNWGKVDRANHPLNCVDWRQATAFCEWAGKRLPTEEEWEYAARGTDGRKFPWGNTDPEGQLCPNWHYANAGTCAVGSFAAGKSPFGLHDMAGNVWEWTSSGYSIDYGNSRTDDSRVLRGGGAGNGNVSFVRSAFRLQSAPSTRTIDNGFRCARAN